ncbi:molybdopterin oxidoreductase family protein [Kiloniella laminariae]|uniref:Molybdopterin oxidoreductase family protein n=1 Tax=Kiloniella laminariae TaxID=454162 RepID=A0ABT4LMZ9_9PROT|nr:molybdopterin oxidoreductase family protein [Kiloniella laminariae]MCZ4282491.1 molybdopterin oxidoreductase family protein [Kiloniella laminariae]
MSFLPTSKQEQVETSPHVSDEVKTTTCYMCACRCGIKVHLRGDQIRYIEGNPDHPVNKGVLCAKGSAGIMQHNSPARLSKPLLRTGERGSGQFKEIEWEEALELATGWLGNIRKTDPAKLAFFTGRDQSQSLTGWWAAKFGTRNFAAHGGFCSVNMAAAGLYTAGGSFWEFGEPDWDLTKYLLMFGVAEDHDSNPIKIGLGKLKGRKGTKFVSVNPVRTGYSGIADEWIGIRPGTDGLFVFALIHELLKAEKIDWQYLSRYTNAVWLVIQNPGAADDGLFARDAEGNPLCFDAAKKTLVSANNPDTQPTLVGEYTLPDGHKAVPAFQLMAERYLDPKYAPDAVAEQIGYSASNIRRIAAEIAEVAFEQEIVLDVPWTDWAGRQQDKMIGRPVSMHAMRGISAHSNGFHTCRAIHVLQMLLGSIDVPGGFRHKPPFPRPCPPGPKPSGQDSIADTPLPGMPLGFPTGPEDLLVEKDGSPKRIDKAYSWEFPLASHGLMHMVIHNAWKGDPYPVDTLFMYMANMSWNSSMNVPGTIKYLTDKNEDGSYKIPRIIYSDAYHSEMVAYADLILPDTTYLERWDCISLLDRPICSAHGPADSIRQPVIKPDRDVRAFQEVLLDLGARLGLPGMVKEDGSPAYPGGYADYITNHERSPGVGPLAGWRGEDGKNHGKGTPNKDQLQRYIDNGCFWSDEFTPEQSYFKFANRSYLDRAQSMCWIPTADRIVMQIYSEPMQKFRLAARGHGKIQPPDHLRSRIEESFDPLPLWYQPLEEKAFDGEDYPLHAITQRPMHMYHSWGSQNAWLRQITAQNRLFINQKTAEKQGIVDDDWIWVISPHGKVKTQVRLMSGVNPDTIWTWNAIGKRKGTWGLNTTAPESNKGFLLNHIISELLPPRADGYRYSNSDPVTGQAAWYDLRVRIEKCDAYEEAVTEPIFDALPPLPNAPGQLAVLRYGESFPKTKTDKPKPETEIHEPVMVKQPIVKGEGL